MSSIETPDLDFDQLDRFQPRSFVPESVDLEQIQQVKEIYEQLLSEEVGSSLALESWVLKRSELDAALDQTGSAIYIRMTCQTDDKERTERYKNFIENIYPVIKPLEDKLNRKFLKLNESYPLSDKYAVYTREIKADIELFREENVALQTELDLLSQEYQSICGAMTVEFDGEEKTLPQMSKYLQETDRSVREDAWRKMAERRLIEKDKLDELFDKMLVLRNQVASNAGCKNFTEYKFRSLHRFDYTPEDCKQYHEVVEKLVVPIWKDIYQKRKEQMGLDSLRPWDTNVDPLGRDALKPFEDVGQLINGCRNIFYKVNNDLGDQFAGMADDGLLDLASRKGKAPGGYQSSLSEARRPFIFMNAVGVDSDVRTLLHEAGHSFHVMASRNEPVYDYRHGPMEFNEVASMAMELLADDFLNEFYSDEDTKRSQLVHLEDIVFTLAWVATIDCFQHWIYENPGHTAEQRKEAWLSVRKRFGSDFIDWSGLEDIHAYIWHRQLHIFEVPFYYIEYGIAQLGALQVWQNAKKDYSSAIEKYRAGLSLGGSKPLPEIYRTAGINFKFSADMIEPLMQMVKEEIAQRY